jgi:hypothetical protein
MKGLLKSFESIIAVLMIVTVFLILFRSGEINPDIEVVTWKYKGFDALKSLDDNNKLATWTLSNDTSSIETALLSLLPLGLNYDVVVCTQTCPSVSISSEKIVSVNYFVTGNTTDIDPREVILYLWRGT